MTIARGPMDKVPAHLLAGTLSTCGETLILCLMNYTAEVNAPNFGPRNDEGLPA